MPALTVSSPKDIPHLSGMSGRENGILVRQEQGDPAPIKRHFSGKVALDGCWVVAVLLIPLSELLAHYPRGA
jgi:hypothetical protein